MSCDGWSVGGHFDEHGHHHEDTNWLGVLFVILFALDGIITGIGILFPEIGAILPPSIWP